MKVKKSFVLLAGFFAVAPVAQAVSTELPVVQVTATREPEPVDEIPAALTVISGEQLRARGANDLRSALSLVAGVEGTPTGDGGPAGSVPALWGLREVDAFLLVIDGVPAGGAFNPQTPQVDLTGVARVEILRGSAPVMYGAASFNGVIHVIHYAAGEAPATLGAGGGSDGSYGASFFGSLPSMGGFNQSAVVNVEKRGFEADREEFKRYHLQYRGGSALGAGQFHVDVDLASLPQKPGSPLLRNDTTGIRSDLDQNANFNPSDAKIDEKRGQLTLGFDLGAWSTTASFTRTTGDIVRGFLRGNAPDVSPAGSPDGNDADAFTQKRQINDAYFDTHFNLELASTASLTVGLDYLYGRGKQNANNYAYFVSLDGKDAPATADEAPDEIAISSNNRDFAGLYAQTDWRAVPGVFDVLAGLRLNRTRETAAGQAIDIAGGGAGDFSASESLTKTRLSGMLGASWYAWKQGRDAFTVYGDYRNSYKPLATDFGPEAEVTVLQPETAASYEAGVKTQLFDGVVDIDLSAFQMDFKNGLTFDSTGARANGGQARFKGVEAETHVALGGKLSLMANAAYHDARNVAFTADDGTDLSGVRKEMSPYVLAGAGLLYQPAHGLNGSLVSNYTGSRNLDDAGQVKVGSFTTVDAALGWQFEKFGVHLNGYTLTDRHDPVSASELQELATNHDAPAFDLVGFGSWRLPGRSVMLNFSMAL